MVSGVVNALNGLEMHQMESGIAPSATTANVVSVLDISDNRQGDINIIKANILFGKMDLKRSYVY